MITWIPTNERLPEQSGKYLTVNMYKQYPCVTAVEYSAKNGLFWVYDIESEETVDKRRREIEDKNNLVYVTHWAKIDENDWVSVDECLPDETGWFLVKVKTGAVSYFTFSNKYQVWNVTDYYTDEVVEHIKETYEKLEINVTHWIPVELPEFRWSRENEIDDKHAYAMVGYL